MRIMFWIFVISAAFASISFGAMAHAKASMSYWTAVWPIIAICWAFLCEKLRKRNL